MTDIDKLADSIRRRGLINPITITREGEIVAGERRLTACRSLGWTHIPVQFIEDMPEAERRLIELDENIQRVDLTWQDRNAFVVEYHRTYTELHPGASQEEVADALGVDRSTVGKHLTVAADPELLKEDTLTTAARRAVVKKERALWADVIRTQRPTSTQTIQCASFLDWAPAYSGPKFNLIHCDFPYGINADRSGQAAVNAVGSYDDSEDIYWQLFHALVRHQDRIIADNAHIMFWFGAKHYEETWNFLRELVGFTFDETPLIWNKVNVGIVPDVHRRPRRVYEMAFFGWRGNAQIHQVRSNLYTVAPSTRSLHPHEKSEEMLRYFMEMLVGPHTSILDPTCGSGSALRAAKALGAGRLLGLELDEGFAAAANQAFEASR